MSDKFTTAFAYSDCWVEDSRLVVLNAVDAHQRGAADQNPDKLVSARPDDKGWQLAVQTQDGQTQTLTTRLLVNAAGPWADDVQHRIWRIGPLRLIKGVSDLDRQLPNENTFLLQNTKANHLHDPL